MNVPTHKLYDYHYELTYIFYCKENKDFLLKMNPDILNYDKTLEEISNEVYRYEILGITKNHLGENENIDDVFVNKYQNEIHTNLSELFERIHIENELYNQMLILSASTLNSSDKKMGFLLLFNYSTFYDIHAIIQDYFVNDNVDENIIKVIIQKLNKIKNVK